MENSVESTVSPAESLRVLADNIQLENHNLKRLKSELNRVIIGQSYMVDLSLIHI